MTFGQSYLTHMKCLENVGLLRTDTINFNGQEIVPIQFLKALLPDPASLGPRTVGKTNIGCIFTGVKDGVKKDYLYLQCLRPSGMLRRGWFASYFLYDRSSSHDWDKISHERNLETSWSV